MTTEHFALSDSEVTMSADDRLAWVKRGAATMRCSGAADLVKDLAEDDLTAAFYTLDNIVEAAVENEDQTLEYLAETLRDAVEDIMCVRDPLS